MFMMMMTMKLVYDF